MLSAALLAADEPPAFEVLPGARHCAVLVSCDHASNRVPRQLGSLGLDPALLQTHISWDIGAAAVTRGLAARLGSTAVLAGYSRLVIDCNRRLDDASSIPVVSDGQLIPANQALEAAERARRAAACFQPYHDALSRELSRLAEAGSAPLLVAVHSFTPVMKGQRRPWDCGVLWDRDPHVASRLLESLRARGDLVVGDNEPYSGRHPADYTVDHHAEAHGRPYACIEIRQDLLGDAAGIARWTSILAEALEPIVERPNRARPTSCSQRTASGQG